MTDYEDNIEDMLADVPVNAPAKKHTPASVNDDELLRIHDSMMDDYELRSAPNSARALREAEDNDLLVVYPEPNQLQIDIDSDHAFSIFLEMKPLLEKYYGIHDCEIHFSRSGAPKRHITVTLTQPMSNYERIALQVACGSDRVREMLGLIQEKMTDPHPTLFLEKKA